MSALRVLLVSSRPFLEGLVAQSGAAIGTDAPAPVLIARITMELYCDPPAADKCDIVIIDVLPEPTAAIEACAATRARWPNRPILGFVSCERLLSPLHLEALIHAGATALVGATHTPDEFASVVHHVARGETIISLGSNCLAAPMLEAIAHDESAESHRRLDETLDLVSLVAAGCSDHEIAETLHLSASAVRHRIERVRQRTGARNRTELAAWAGATGFYGNSNWSGRQDPRSRRRNEVVTQSVVP